MAACFAPRANYDRWRLEYSKNRPCNAF